jgi:simple sugar transport system ATP-binding protein
LDQLDQEVSDKDKSDGAEAKVMELSGGNQQKIIIAKSLAQELRLIILDELTRGIDLAIIAEIHQISRN